MLNGPSHGWYALQTLAGREGTVKAVLDSKLYETFLPLHRVRRKRADRVASIVRPLFPGYLFCRLTPDTSGRIVTTPGVVRIVSVGKTHVEIEDTEVDAIRRITASGLPASPWRYLQSGQLVRIVHGPLRGLEGIVVREGRDNRLIVSVHLLQRAVAVQVEEDWIIPEVDSPPHHLRDHVLDYGQAIP